MPAGGAGDDVGGAEDRGFGRPVGDGEFGAGEQLPQRVEQRGGNRIAPGHHQSDTGEGPHAPDREAVP